MSITYFGLFSFQFAKDIVRYRGMWWASKCIWMILSVTAFFLLGLILIMGLTWLNGGHSLACAFSSFGTLPGKAGASDAALRLLLALGVQFTLSLALSSAQMSLAFVVRPRLPQRPKVHRLYLLEP